MKIEQIITRDNELMDAGKLDEQIVRDFETYLNGRYEYQTEHLDKKVKGKSHHYDEWSKENQQKITYAERVLECVRAQMVKNIYAATLTPGQMDIMMQTDGRVKGIVEVGVYELIAADGFDDFRTKLSERLTGSLLLKDVRYQLLGLDGGFLYFEVSGDASEILAPVSEPENNE